MTAIRRGYYRTDTPLLEVTIWGEPIPEGSTRSRGKRTVYANQKILMPWRDRMVNAFRAEMDALHQSWPAHYIWPVGGPLFVEVTFTRKKPASAPVKRRTYPVTRPDTDKLCRAVGDSLQDAGVVHDDAQILEWSARKVYPYEYTCSLPTPGAVVAVYRIED